MYNRIDDVTLLVKIPPAHSHGASAGKNRKFVYKKQIELL